MELPGVKTRIDEVFNELAQITGRNPKCPFCANDDWARISGGWVVEIRTVYEPNPTRSPLQRPALGLSCTRCGFLRTHLIDPTVWGLPAEGVE